MKRLILVRHAEPAAAWGDHDDPGLSELGKAQAARLAEALSTEGILASISSPLARCQETAEPHTIRTARPARIERAVAEIPTPADVDDRRLWLNEVLVGRWSDLGPELGRWRNDIATALMALPQDTVVFSHFVAINAAVGLATGAKEVVTFRPGHASRTELVTDGRTLKLVRLGEEAPIQLL